MFKYGLNNLKVQGLDMDLCIINTICGHNSFEVYKSNTENMRFVSLWLCSLPRTPNGKQV
jgi:ferredoxin